MMNGMRRFADVLLPPDHTGGASTAQAGVGMEAPLEDATMTTGRGWRNTARLWRGPVAKQGTGYDAAMEWDGDGATVA